MKVLLALAASVALASSVSGCAGSGGVFPGPLNASGATLNPSVGVAVSGKRGGAPCIDARVCYLP